MLRCEILHCAKSAPPDLAELNTASVDGFFWRIHAPSFRSFWIARFGAVQLTAGLDSQTSIRPAMQPSSNLVDVWLTVVWVISAFSILSSICLIGQCSGKDYPSLFLCFVFFCRKDFQQNIECICVPAKPQVLVWAFVEAKAYSFSFESVYLAVVVSSGSNTWIFFDLTMNIERPTAVLLPPALLQLRPPLLGECSATGAHPAAGARPASPLVTPWHKLQITDHRS
jgi:hypothetical protein